MTPSWKHLYPLIKTAVLNLDSLDALLQQVVEQITQLYQAECLLWSGLEWGVADALRVFTTPETANRYAVSLGFAYPPPPVESTTVAIQQFRPRSLPTWLFDQQNAPRLLQLKTGDLILPVTSRGSYFGSALPRDRAANSLQFVVQLVRPADLVSTAEQASAGSFRGWTEADIESLEVLGSQLGLAYSALYWRQRLEQSRQQVALLGRVAHLLNSTLSPDEIVSQIMAELGNGLDCDRSLLIDLRLNPAVALAVWDAPDCELPALEPRQIRQSYWQNVIEMFMQGGASYLQLGLQEPTPDPLQVWLQDMGAQSVLVLPLFVQGEFFGGIALLSYRYPRSYLIDELQTVRQVADQAALALTNVQHYQRLWQKQEELRVQSSTQRASLRDPLTQLLNRRSLEQELEQLSLSAIWTVSPIFCVIVCDIDYFKPINDAHGHPVGDQVLQAVAKRLQGQLRRGTSAYRYGGEEFAVILTDTPLALALDVAERLRQAVRSTPVLTPAGSLDVTASFGLAQRDLTTDRTAWDVLQHADRALYEAKRLGRDRVYAIDPSREANSAAFSTETESATQFL
ncbi:MAG: sensor domain-containing diguanylate cyclase [Pegethrix bostrychoides GSE-TBD4-15B]|jgi:diguanylate cyclase (GGDEF)-like protein|uniref:Sensor domain-containing diguanylate cyclase n=1 Tax=Pegethrix bostrychoides GSE-TBD4-15B TaxID=2839662 RepID=A0A951P719_9CYAN|nr:sensor domain-containing diguanylate cyclase [Pegethrix bostrychoides GSE-TBD4-15B]